MIALAETDDDSQVYVLEDGSEIEVTIIELEGIKAKEVKCVDQAESIVKELLD